MSAETIKLYKKARKHNWDNGYDLLYQILENENCDKGTALMMYWLSAPQYFTQFSNSDECGASNRDNYNFVKHLEHVFNSIKKEIIIYDPEIDGMKGKEKENIKSPIPQEMYKATTGEIMFNEINVYE